MNKQLINRVLVIASVLMCLGGLGLRFFDLSADPPRGVCLSAGFYFDGISNAHGARSYVLTGNLRPDEWDSYIYSPVYTLLQIPWFSCFGTGLSSVNGFAAFWSLLSMLLLVLLFRPYGRVAVCLAALIASTDYLLIHLGRVGLVENLLIPFMLGAVLCVQLHRRAIGWTVLCGFLTAMSFIIKPIAPYFPVAVLLGVLYKAWLAAAQSEGKVLRAIALQGGAFFAGGLCALIPWLLLYRIPNAGAIAAFGSEWMDRTVPDSLGALLTRLLRTAFFLNISSIHNLWIFSVATLAATGALLLMKPRRVSPEALLMAAWLTGGALFVSLLEAQPVRYVYPILPAIYGMFIYGASLLLEAPALDLRPRRRIWVADILAVLGLTLVIRYFVIYKISIEPITPPDWNRFVARLFISAVLAVLTWSGFRVLFMLLFKSYLPLRASVRYLLVLLVAAYFAWHSFSASRLWRQGRSHAIVETSRTLGERYPGMIIGGTSACAAVVENNAVAIRISKPGFCNFEKPFERFGITHTFITDYAGERKRFMRLYPEAMNDSTLVDSFDVCGYRFFVYQMKHYNRDAGVDPARPRDGDK